MSYKKCLEGMIREESQRWVHQLSLNAGSPHCTLGEDVTFEDVTSVVDDGYTWQCKVKVYTGRHTTVTVVVGGTVDPWYGILCSCIWNMDGLVIWLDEPQSRELLNIEKFEIK